MTTTLPSIENWRKGNENDISTIENCFCPSCGNENATTTMLPTKIPSFREIIIMSLYCKDCNFRNSEVTFSGTIQEQGLQLTLTLTSPEDLNRQLIKSDSATLTIPSIEFEIPPTTQRGSISTIEGFLKTAANNLEMLQGERLRMGDVDNFYRCKGVIEQLKCMVGDDGAGDSSSSDNEEEEEDAEEDAEENGSQQKEKGNDFQSFVIILDDPAGNSYIENPSSPSPDPNLQMKQYYRTPMQDMALGLQPSQKAVEDGTIDDTNPMHKNIVNVSKEQHLVDIDLNTSKNIAQKGKDGDENKDKEGTTESGRMAHLGKQEALTFPTTCPHCHEPSETKMCMTDIPHFKEVVIMSLLCDNCGYKSNEIKGGGAIPKYGIKITLQVTSVEDLAREVLKSDTAGLEIPDIELQMEEGGLDGLYTTVEGLLKKIHGRLEIGNPFSCGDAAKQQHITNDGGTFSQPSLNHVRYEELLRKLMDMAEGKALPFALIVSDPLANSFVGPVPDDAMTLALQAEKEGSHDCYDAYVDAGMTIEEYERTDHQNERLGLNDIKTENYQRDRQKGKEKESDGGDGDFKECVDWKKYYGTDQMEDLPDRLRWLDYRGPDHPHDVGKAPVEGDTTVMGAGSAKYATPGMVQRGTRAPKQSSKHIPAISEDDDEM